ncbi:MAG: DM13 domain-containing protein, partial [Micromonosporaceae bacterium]
GTAQLIRLPTGRYQLILRDLSTSDGPDLRVWLTDQEVRPGAEGWRVFDDGRYVELGRLKGNHGTQVYDVPADLDISQYRSVSIWCQRFSVSFGAAALT